MKKRFVLFCLFCLMLCKYAQAQDFAEDSLANLPPYRSSAYLEILGNSGIGLSGNYERLFPLKSKKAITISARSGLGFFLSPFDAGVALTVPTEVSLLYGKRFVKPDFGLGFTVVGGGGIFAASMLRLGVRLQKPGKPNFVRLGVSFWILNTIAAAGDLFIYPAPGLVIGANLSRR